MNAAEGTAERAALVLRPMNLGEILDRTFEVYRTNFALFVGIAALPALAMLGIHAADIGWLHSKQMLGPLDRNKATAWAAVLAFAYIHIHGFLEVLIGPAFVQAVSKVHFDESISIRASLRFAAVRWRTYLWLAFFKILAQMVVPEVLAFSLAIGSYFVFDKLGMVEGFFPFGGVLLLLTGATAIVFFWVAACIAFAIPAASLEQLSGLRALRRSWRLTRNSRWRILIAWMMVFLFTIVLEFTAQFLIRRATVLAYSGQHHSGLNHQIYELIVYFFYAAIGAVVGPLYPIAVTLLYYDQRVRKEGYDLERMMEAAGLEAPRRPGDQAASAEAEEESLSRWSRVARQHWD